MLMLNVKSVFEDGKVNGVSMAALVFFTTYAAWMVFYFHHHQSTWPMIGAGLNLFANASYLGTAYYYTRRPRERKD